MTDLNRGLSEVPGLIAERKRYEAWIAALDERRETTPRHVFERVQADYRTRLQRVAAELASHRQAIEEERKNVESRLSLLEAEEQMRRDERAELELRSHVGELEGEEALAAFGTVDETIAHLVEEKGGLQARISELESLLEPAETPVAAATAGLAEGAVEAESTSPNVASAASDDVGTAEGAPADGEPVAEATAETSAELAPPPSSSELSSEVATPGSEQESRKHAQSAEAAAAPGASSNASEAAVGGADGAAGSTASNGDGPSTGTPHRPSDLHPSGGTFDELKFLDTVIGKETAKPRGSKASEGAPPRGLDGHAREPSGVAPLGANVPGHTPIVLRPAVAMDQSKTLKCSECGAANYPTEWYCERCGAELAAL